MIVHDKQLDSITWQRDYESRINPTLMTRLLRKAIPVLESTQWRIIDVQEGACTSELPLSIASTNQHGTHQAALISLSADYTGGMAVASLLRGVPLAGIHQCHEDESAALWLASMNVRYQNPSTGHLQARCVITREQKDQIRSRYFSGKRVLVSLPVTFTSNDQVVAIADMKYFAQPSRQLTPSGNGQRISALHAHKLKASARMIAGLRATMSDQLWLDQNWERQAAGPHGILLSNRLQSVLPSLRDMVAARTRHIDQTLLAMDSVRQVIILGVGLDMRPLRLGARLDTPIFFEVDLPEMLEERARVLSKMDAIPRVRRRLLAANFLKDDVAKLLREHPDFDPHLPTAVIYEGCSMYFEQEKNEQLIRSVSELIRHPASCLWSDFVTQAVVDGTTENADIEQFLAGMSELGESFIFGHDDPGQFLQQCGYGQQNVVRCSDFLNRHDGALTTYQFTVGWK